MRVASIDKTLTELDDTRTSSLKGRELGIPGSLILRPVVGFFLASFLCLRWCSATYRPPNEDDKTKPDQEESRNRRGRNRRMSGKGTAVNIREIHQRLQLLFCATVFQHPIQETRGGMHDARRHSEGGVGLRETSARARNFCGGVLYNKRRSICPPPLIARPWWYACMHHPSTVRADGAQASNTWGKISNRPREDVQQTLAHLQPG